MGYLPCEHLLLEVKSILLLLRAGALRRKDIVRWYGTAVPPTRPVMFRRQWCVDYNSVSFGEFFVWQKALRHICGSQFTLSQHSPYKNPDLAK